MVLLSCYQLAESFATTQTSQTSTSSPSKINDDDTSNARRVFVAGISHTCTEQSIRSTLSKFGSINEVTIVGQANDTASSKRKAFSPYAFVTFDSSTSAQLAIDAPKPSPPQSNDSTTTSETAVYKEIQAARSIKSRKRSNAARLREEEILSKVTIFGKEANCIIQVQLTHLDRLVDYLNRNYNKKNSGDDIEANIEDGTACKVVGTANSASKNISLLFLSCTNPSTLTRSLITDPILVRAINKSYIVKPGQLVEGNLSTDVGCDELAKSVYESISKQQQEGNKKDVSLRLKIFPPKYQSKLLTSFDALIEQAEKSSTNTAATASTSINIDPKDFTHMLSIVEIYQYKGRGWENNDVKSNNLYMWGLSEASLNEDVVDANNLITLDGNLVVDNNNDGSNNNDGTRSDDGEVEVGRAYYKLKEAIETYKSSNNNEGGRNKIHSDLYDESVVALDCGSAPGGWTKYLIEHFNCKTVYSIDPGKLAKSVSKLEQTKHIQMKIQDAIPLLLKEEDKQVKIWVSDMCLHNMESQVDLLLMAKDSGLLSSDCFVVLTLKCIVGHSKSAYDAQVKKVVDKLCDKASMESVEIFHLFSNRSGERTVMGYLK